MFLITLEDLCLIVFVEMLQVSHHLQDTFR